MRGDGLLPVRIRSTQRLNLIQLLSLRRIVKMRLGSKRRPAPYRMRLFSFNPARSGASMQAPRTIRSIRAPDWRARIRPDRNSGSVSALHLMITRARTTLLAAVMVRSR